MSHSIKKQMIAVCAGMVVVAFVACFLVNSWFLGNYYLINKERELKDIYKELSVVLKEIQENDGEADSTLLETMLEKGNVSLVVLDNKGRMMVTNQREYQLSSLRLQEYIFHQNNAGKDVLKKTKNYEIIRSKGKAKNTEYLEMWGPIGSDCYFLVRSPMESIHESVRISNRFLLYIGVVIIGISALLAWFFAKKITDPIEELAGISKRMADLDFDVKYNSGGKNEIGTLGANFNLMSKHLEETVSELKTANNELQRDIEKKEKLETMRNEFIGNVSHELKTPIALIQGYAEGLKEGIADDDLGTRDYYCDVITDEASKMNQMVKNLLTLNQLEFGDHDSVFERFDLVSVVQGVLQSLSIMIEQSGAKVNFVHEENEFVWADEFKTEQVLRNYITNALHYVKDDMIIEIRTVKTENGIRTSVFNTGDPVPEEDQERIWDKFYKVDKARTRQYGGNGIGLSIVKAIMESFHKDYGMINYDNGVAFWFELDAK